MYLLSPTWQIGAILGGGRVVRWAGTRTHVQGSLELELVGGKLRAHQSQATSSQAQPVGDCKIMLPYLRVERIDEADVKGTQALQGRC